MAYQRVPETAEIRVIFEMMGAEVSCIFHAQKAGGYSQGDLDTLAGTIDANDGPAFAGIMSLHNSYVRTDVRGLDVENDLTASANAGAVVGSLGASSMPRNIAFCVAQRSGLTGRSARGRVYIPGMDRNQIQTTNNASDYVTAAYAAAAVGVVEGLRADIENIGAWNAVIVSRYHEGVKRDEAVTFQWISSDYTSMKVATRRARLQR